MNTGFSVYTLKCEDGRYYVGSSPTHTINTRFLKHMRGEGSKFCWNHKPVEIVDTINNLTSTQAYNRETPVVYAILERENNLDAARGGDINYALGTRFWVPKHLQYLDA